jgi:hypothetical protein
MGRSHALCRYEPAVAVGATLLEIGISIDNRTLCDEFGVGNMGGIRVNNRRSLIVLVSNNTDPTYRNVWRDGILHFVGRGSVGPQVLSHQNKTLANATKHGWTIHLFEVFEKSRYTYAGEVELADEPYLSDQPDARAEDRFVWIFPLRKKQSTQPHQSPPSVATIDHLPYGAYAVIDAGLTDTQRALVDEAMDRLKESGVSVFDARDVELRRYEKALARWHEGSLDHVRNKVKGIIASKKRAAKAAGRAFALVDDELRVNSASTEADLRAALSFLDYDELRDQEQVFEEARRAVPVPDPPKFLKEANEAELEMPVLRAKPRRTNFSDFT